MWSIEPYYDWLCDYVGLEYWKTFRGRKMPAYRPQHHISARPQPMRQAMRSVNRNR